MTRESMAWLGMALWLKELGYSIEQAVLCAGPLLEAIERAAREATS